MFFRKTHIDHMEAYRENTSRFSDNTNMHLHIKERKKTTLSPKEKVLTLFSQTKEILLGRAPFLVPSDIFGQTLSGSLTVEAAIVLPVFFVCMLTVMQFLNVYQTAVRLGSALTETSEEMAIGAYVSVYGDEDAGILTGTLTTAYGSARTRRKAGDLSTVQNTNFLLSSFLRQEDMIHLVCTYRPKAVSGMVRLPWIVFLQRGSVRAWTGRAGSGGKKKEEGDGSDDDAETVYVTETGTVYHKDANCTHIRLRIRTVSKSRAVTARNRSGARYTPCEKCGGHAGSRVYITTDGNRYHSSLDCSGLKRTVRQMKMSEAGHLRACSRCGG